jgi:hypothetical protein
MHRTSTIATLLRARPRLPAVITCIALTGLAPGVLAYTAGVVLPPHAAAPRAAGHADGCAERVQSRLFFGLNRPSGPVSAAEWERFVADVVTPRFPDGLTILQATGQWRSDDRLEQEASRVIEVVSDDSADARRRIDAIVGSFKTRYQQQSVMVSRQRLEVCF